MQCNIANLTVAKEPAVQYMQAYNGHVPHTNFPSHHYFIHGPFQTICTADPVITNSFLTKFTSLLHSEWWNAGVRSRLAYGPADATATHYLLLQ